MKTVTINTKVTLLGIAIDPSGKPYAELQVCRHDGTIDDVHLYPNQYLNIEAIFAVTGRGVENIPVKVECTQPLVDTRPKEWQR